ncbi:MAG TPA: portal protein [Hyphomicrobiaceae bacterium]|jgi:hypothetical protein
MAAPAADPTAIVRRYRELHGQQDNYRTRWQTLAEFFAPYKANITIETFPGTLKTQRLFDSAGVHAANKLAAMIHGGLTNQAQKWFSLRLRQRDLNDVKDNRDWLEDVAEETYLALGASNFYTEMSEVYLDLPVFCTAGLYCQEKTPARPNVFGGLQFTALVIGHYVIAEDSDGRVDTVIRDFELSWREIWRLWGDGGEGLRPGERSRLPQEAREQVENNPERRQKLLHAVYPRPKAVRDYGAPALKKPWASCYLLEKQMVLLAESGYDEFPFAVARWSKDSRSPYGTGPGWIAYPDVRTLNRAVEIKLGALAKALDPPLMQAEDAVLGTLSLEPTAINVVTAWPPQIAPLESKARFDVDAVEEQRLERKISEIFYGPQIMEITKEMTATEASFVQEEILRMLGPAANRLQNELLSHTIERAIAIQYRGGVLPPPPQALARAGFSVDIDIVYEGPLARAQRSRDLIAIQRKNEWLLGQLQMGNTQAADLFDTDEEGRIVAEVAGVPSSIIRGQQTVASMRQQKAQQQADQARLHMLAGAAQAAGQAAPMVKALSDARAQQQAAPGSAPPPAGQEAA